MGVSPMSPTGVPPVVELNLSKNIMARTYRLSEIKYDEFTVARASRP